MLAANVIYTRPFQESTRGDLSFNPLDHYAHIIVQRDSSVEPLIVATLGDPA